MGILMEIDTSPVTDTLTELGAAGGVVVAAGIAISAGIFGVMWLWKKGRKAASS